jgi:hypothetical protein
MSGERGGQGIDWTVFAFPHNARVPAQSPFHKQVTEKRKDGRLCHLLAAKKLLEFHCNLLQTACG